MREYRKQKIIPVIVLFTGIFALSIFDELLLNVPIKCLHKEITGYRCPLCGLSHAVYYFSGFRFREAFSANPVVFLFAFYAFAELAAFAYPATFLIKIRKISLVAVAGGLVVIYLLRFITAL